MPQLCTTCPANSVEEGFRVLISGLAALGIKAGRGEERGPDEYTAGHVVITVFTNVDRTTLSRTIWKRLVPGTILGGYWIEDNKENA